eukprot:scaffold13321_cov193-Alexandrium_tamarense.AAC.18
MSCRSLQRSRSDVMDGWQHKWQLGRRRLMRPSDMSSVGSLLLPFHDNVFARKILSSGFVGKNSETVQNENIPCEKNSDVALAAFCVDFFLRFLRSRPSAGRGGCRLKCSLRNPITTQYCQPKANVIALQPRLQLQRRRNQGSSIVLRVTLRP